MRTLFPIGVILLILLALPGLFVFAADLLGYGADLNAWLESRYNVSHRVAIALPAAIALFAVPPIIILLYFLRLKRKPVAVPSTFLWKKSIEDLHVNRLMQWIRRNILLLLQLFIALALIYGILGPRMHGAISGGKYYILMIDNSASMSATDVSPSRLEWAKAEALKEIDAATDADTGMVIVFSDLAEIRQSYTTNRAALRRAVEQVTPTQRPTRLDEALNLAASLANPSRSTEDVSVAPTNPEPGKERTYVQTEGLQADLHLYSDGKFPPVPDFALSNLNLAYHVPPAARDDGTSNNIGILSFTAERDYDDPLRVIARANVRNYRAEPAEIRARVEVLDGDGRLMARYDDDQTRTNGRREPIPARAEQPDLTFTIADLPENTDIVLHLKLDGLSDAFSLDNEAWVVLGVVRKARVLVVGPPNAILRNVFDIPSTKKIADITYLTPEVLLPTADPKDYRTPAQEGRYDLVVFDRCTPANVDQMPNSNTFFIGLPPPPYSSPGTAKKDEPNATSPVSGPSVRGWVGRHPVMRNLTALDEIDIAEAYQFSELPPRTLRLIEGSENLVLLAALSRQAFTDLTLTFPLLTSDGRWNTNWPLKVSFPLFIRNVLFFLGNIRDAGSEEAVQPGEVKPLRPAGATTIKISTPAGDTQTLERGSRPFFTFTNTERVGLYSVSWTDPANGAVQSRRFAVNLFDSLESDLCPVSAVTVGNTTVEAGEPRKQPRDLWKWPVLAGLIVVLLEWWIYNRRVQI